MAKAYQPASKAGPGPRGAFGAQDYVPISVDPFPNPIQPGQTFTVTVVVSPGLPDDPPAPNLPLELDVTCDTIPGFPVRVDIPAGSTSGTSAEIMAPDDLGNHQISTQHGGGEASISLFVPLD